MPETPNIYTPSVEKIGFLTVPELAIDIITELTTHGFTMLSPAAIPVIPTNDTREAFLTAFTGEFCLAATSTVDPLAGPTALTVGNVTIPAQPYRIYFKADVNFLQIVVGTDTQITVNATTKAITLAKDADPLSAMSYYPGLIGKSGALQATPVGSAGVGADEHFIDRYDYKDTGTRASHPMSYKLSIAQNADTTYGANGFALAVWEPGKDAEINRHSWLVIQRSVNTTVDANRTSTGLANVYGKSPVFCLFRVYRGDDKLNISGQTPTGLKSGVDIITKLVVRESDIARQSLPVDASATTADNYASVPSTSSQIVSLLEDGSYNVNLVSGLNTARFTYPNDELDLIGYTSADVISTGQTIRFKAYGETVARQYYALVATGTFNTGIRFFIRTA